MQNKNTSKNANTGEKRPMLILLVSLGVCERKGD